MAGGRIWRKREDALIRKFYRRGTAAADRALRRALPKRSWGAIQHRSRVLGATRVRRWSANDDRVLRDAWQEISRRALMGRLPGRRWKAIHAHAERLGLPMGVPQGHSSIERIARIAGVNRDTMERILAWASIRVLCTYPGRDNRGASCRRHVDTIDAEGAVVRWVNSETIQAAAERYGMWDNTLREWLIADGAYVPRGRAVRSPIPSPTIDRAVRASARRVLRWATSLRRAATRPGYRPLARWRSCPVEVRCVA